MLFETCFQAEQGVCLSQWGSGRWCWPALGSDVVLGPITLCSSHPASPGVEEVLGHGVMSLQLPWAGGQLIGCEEGGSSLWAEMVVEKELVHFWESPTVSSCVSLMSQ